MNITNVNDDYLFERPSPVDCSTLKIISFYLAFIFMIGVLSNTTLIWILCSCKRLRTRLNIFIITLCVINLIATLIEVPLVMISNYKCR